MPQRAGATRVDGKQLTSNQFEGLLAALASDPAQAGERYERLRGILVLFFLRRALATPEDLADLVLDRLARRLFEGEAIVSPEAYALGIARFVVKEQNSRQQREISASSDFVENILQGNVTTDRGAVRAEQLNHERMEQHEDELDAMETCLARLPKADAVLLSAYYLPVGSGPVDARRRLAEEYALTPQALRARIFQLRRVLRECIRSRTDTGSRGGNTAKRTR